LCICQQYVSLRYLSECKTILSFVTEYGNFISARANYLCIFYEEQTRMTDDDALDTLPTYTLWYRQSYRHCTCIYISILLNSKKRLI